MVRKSLLALKQSLLCFTIIVFLFKQATRINKRGKLFVLALSKRTQVVLLCRKQMDPVTELLLYIMLFDC